ncbi:hypothetical protein Rhe02_87140 [Rhizocola hellebori]|uniref:YbaB/EbfC family DNA-binding protein n=1 Tax=Rhizocola hellebori TaxID=1392758 RepID=A0A8J3VLH0_9ACTN|nr:hypothetical protein [Rhizocola hellebori]GIH10647.1 hypothetical protein Rhe02_87140 [Rhizocola hellebori]
MAEDILREMGGHAASQQRLIHDFQGGMPQTVQATDPSGVVQVTLDAEGLPASFEVDEGWARSLHPTAFGPAVAAAFAAATKQRLTAWASLLEKVDLPTSEVDEQPVAAQAFQPPSRPEVPVHPREVGELLRELLEITADLEALTEPQVRQATGSAASGMLTLTLGSDGALSCSADQAWASDKTGSELTSALNTALAAARSELVNAANASPADRAARLLNEAAAFLRGD